jgi:hypothetical protein
VAAAADEHQQALGDDGAAMKELEAQQPSYRSLAAPVTNPVDKFALLPAFLKVRGLVKEHIDSFNYFITMGIRKIIEANNRIEARNDPNIYLKYVLSVLFYSIHSFHSDTTALQQSSIHYRSLFCFMPDSDYPLLLCVLCTYLSVSARPLLLNSVQVHRRTCWHAIRSSGLHDRKYHAALLPPY